MELVSANLHGPNGETFPVVTCSGDLDIATCEEFRTAILRQLGGEPSIILVDLASVPFIDSTGLSVLISCHKAAVAAGSECRFVSAVPKVLRVVQTTQLDRFLSIHPTLESAMGVI